MRCVGFWGIFHASCTWEWMCYIADGLTQRECLVNLMFNVRSMHSSWTMSGSKLILFELYENVLKMKNKGQHFREENEIFCSDFTSFNLSKIELEMRMGVQQQPTSFFESERNHGKRTHCVGIVFVWISLSLPVIWTAELSELHSQLFLVNPSSFITRTVVCGLITTHRMAHKPNRYRLWKHLTASRINETLISNRSSCGIWVPLVGALA